MRILPTIFNKLFFLILLILALASPSHSSIVDIVDTSASLAVNNGFVDPAEYAGCSDGMGSGFGRLIGDGVNVCVDSSDVGNLVFGITEGGAPILSSAIVIYIDSIPGGYSGTDVLLSGYTPWYLAASGGMLTMDLLFAPEFQADFAVVIKDGRAYLIELTDQDYMTPSILLNLSFFDVTFPGPMEVGGLELISIGLAPGDTFKYIVTALNLDIPVRANEYHGVSPLTEIPPDNTEAPVFLAPGDFNTFTTYAADADNDGLLYAQEDLNLNGVMDLGETNPNDDDTDDDGLLDGSEDANGDGVWGATETDPLNPDTDADGLMDGLEAGLSLPEGNDTDAAVFIPDGDGGVTTTNPIDPDSDDDTLSDGMEDANANGVVDASETDPNDPDTDGDTILDNLDADPLNQYICQDLDADGCDDCSEVGLPVPTNDGTDTDGDGVCNFSDIDDDNDGCPDHADPYSVIWSPDTDYDGFGNDCDNDDDNDGVLDVNDTSPLNPFICADADADTCDDCSVAVDGFGPLPDYNPINDGVDFDSDGMCDNGDLDDDDDGVLDPLDVAPLNYYSCSDIDNDSCDDCSQGVGQAPLNDGLDTDGDGICDLTDKDNDNDGYDVPVDCNDSNAAVNPGATEIVGDDIDNNCSGTSICYADLDHDGYRNFSATVNSTIDESCDTVNGEAMESALIDCDDMDAMQNPGAEEIIGDGKDNNCDGTSICYADSDRDGDRQQSGTVNSTINESCETVSGEALFAAPIDCDDFDSAIYSGAIELRCDGVDNNCNGTIDEGRVDNDADGVDECSDCNDNDPDNYPGNVEICDAKDNDCDAIIDNGLSTDSDADGFFTPDSCASPATDCDDSNSSINPAALEIIGDGVDSNCDAVEYCYQDGDLDGYRLDEVFRISLDLDCTDPMEAPLSAPIDCNDSDEAISPAAEEICDGIDNNCDGNIDENLDCSESSAGGGSGGGCFIDAVR